MNVPTSPSSYSRWDHIADSEDEDGGKVEERPTTPEPAVLPPLEIRDDLEDYFRRLDERVATREGGPADVARFGDGELDALLAASATTLEAAGECAICLGDVDAGGAVARLPCAARHAFHGDCVRSWLKKNTHCPLCRVDLLPIHRARAVERRPPPSPRALGFTRDGGTISRWEPAPAPDVPRPDYVPAHLRDSAGYVEVEYPDQGIARVWRVARGSNDN